MNHHRSSRTESGSKAGQLDGEIVRAIEITAGQREQMFRLMCRYYDNMCRHTFDNDLAEKDWVIVAKHPRSGKIMGFSTQRLIDVWGVGGASSLAEPGKTESENSTPIKVLFSGDTIIDREYWARNPLAQLWGRLSLTLIEEYPDHELFWFLISKGFRTYRFLPVFFREFFPRFDAETPVLVKKLIDRLGAQRYPALFDSSTGIVRANEFGCKLRKGVADVTRERLDNEHIRFFDRMNPGHLVGDELCCLSRLSRGNFKRGAYRVIGNQTAVEL